jgi:hypothetical protein
MGLEIGVDAGWMTPFTAERRDLAAVSLRAGPVVSDSRFMLRQLERAFTGVAGGVEALPAPAPTTTGPAPAGSGALRLGYFGVPSWRKGLDLLLSAVDRVDGVELDIFGPASYEHEPQYSADLVRRAAEMSNVTWHPPYPADEAAERMRSVDLVVVPSRAESLPGVVKEALAAGRPVLAAATAGIPELVTAAHGWLVPRESAEALRERIVELARQPLLVRRAWPNYSVAVSDYVDRLLPTYALAAEQVDAAGIERALQAALAQHRQVRRLQRDTLYQRGVGALAAGRRSGVVLLLRSLHRDAVDRFLLTLTWLTVWPMRFGHAFDRVHRVGQNGFGDAQGVRLLLRWARQAIRPAGYRDRPRRVLERRPR